MEEHEYGNSGSAGIYITTKIYLCHEHGFHHICIYTYIYIYDEECRDKLHWTYEWYLLLGNALKGEMSDIYGEVQKFPMFCTF